MYTSLMAYNLRRNFQEDGHKHVDKAKDNLKI